ncbi:MAG: lycopene cyclase domain-containing protein [Bacteroidia bacterium]
MRPELTYIMLHVGAFTFPFLLSFDKKVAFWRSWKFLFPAILIVAALFVIWDIYFTKLGVWGFNPDYVLGYYLVNLPFEEVLFFITIPYCCIFIYACIEAYIKRDVFAGFHKWITAAAMIITLTVGLLNLDKYYTSWTGLISAALLAVLLFVEKAKWMSRFWLSYIVVLIPFFICNGILTSKPVVWYNDAENLGIRMWTIPADDLMYNLIMLLGVTWIFERLRNRKKTGSAI